MTIDQEQFLDVIDVEEAHRRYDLATAHLAPRAETVALESASGRVLAEDLRSPVNVTSFDRSNVDGFAVRSEDTWEASETEPRRLRVTIEASAPGQLPRHEVRQGEALPIATGAPLPRGANAVVMVEHTNREGAELEVSRAVVPGGNVTFAGTDISQGETIAHASRLLTAREIGVLASTGHTRVPVFAKPRVAIISTGDELVDPSSDEILTPGRIIDSNSWILAEAVREAGGEPHRLGICPDKADQLREMVHGALCDHDIVLMSGGTSKGAGDISYRIAAELDPGLVVHGVALKPGKPVCLALHHEKPVVVLPGFPTSAIFTFHEFVAPLIARMTGRRRKPGRRITARAPFRIISDKGRTEFVLVMLVPSTDPEEPPIAWPIGKGSGSVTTFSHADAFVRIDRHQELVEKGEILEATLLSEEIEPVDLVVIGSQCRGLDEILATLRGAGFSTRSIAAGSSAGLEAVKRGECDLAGIHLWDPATGSYNAPFVDDTIELIHGYVRVQGIAFREDDERFEGRSLDEATNVIRSSAGLVMINRNRGSGTRALIDRILEGARPAGYWVEPKSHEAVASAVAQRRADWGVCIETVARSSGLGFIPIGDERYDFAVARSRIDRAPVRRFVETVGDPAVRERLRGLGFSHDNSSF
ncbi:MAG: molybdopterin biosynthesis protein [Acidobacteria bacterium]|nr:molybdopterin biosynthesis protein [Acidobacteriota bacterium]